MLNPNDGRWRQRNHRGLPPRRRSAALSNPSSCISSHIILHFPLQRKPKHPGKESCTIKRVKLERQSFKVENNCIRFVRRWCPRGTDFGKCTRGHAQARARHQLDPPQAARRQNRLRVRHRLRKGRIMRFIDETERKPQNARRGAQAPQSCPGVLAWVAAQSQSSLQRKEHDMNVFELLPRPLGNIFRILSHFHCNSPLFPDGEGSQFAVASANHF